MGREVNQCIPRAPLTFYWQQEAVSISHLLFSLSLSFSLSPIVCHSDLLHPPNVLK